MQVLVIGCSLNPSSRSQVMAREATRMLRDHGAGADHIDLRDWHLPLCDGGESARIDPAVPQAIHSADAILLSVPVYNYAVSAATKNLIELTGDAWADQIVGFMCAAGGRGSYMAAMGLAGSFMLDFHCLIVPRIVYATDADFGGDRLDSDLIRERLWQMTGQTVRLAEAVRHIDRVGGRSG